MAKKPVVPERGPGSNQYSDKPPRSPSAEEVSVQQQRAAAAASALQDFVSAEETALLDEWSSADESPVAAVRYEAMLRHPANYYKGREITAVEDEELNSEWDTVYSSQMAIGGEQQFRQWHPAGNIVVGYEFDEEAGESAFVVSVSSVAPPDELLAHYGVEDSSALVFAENDRIRVGVNGELDDSDPAEPLPAVPAIPYAFLPEVAQDRIREILNFHVQIGPIWEAHYRESDDTWSVLVKYGDAFRWETWPPEKIVGELTQE
jgi:hypothetical protein